MLIWRRRSECSPGESPPGSESIANLNVGAWNGGEDHPHSLGPTTNQADDRNGGEDHPHSLVPTTNQTGCRNGGENHLHSLAPTTNQANGRNGGEDRLHSLANTTNHDRTSHVEEMEGKPRRKRDTPLENITTFRGKHDVLSNFYPCTIRVFERTFASSEHAYQFMKAMSHGKVNVAKDIIQARNACEAKRLGKRVITERVWETERLEVMRQIIRRKYECVPRYRHELMKAELIIVEAVPGDNFWSCGLSKEEVGWWNPENWPGKNIMGNLHMELREEVRRGGTE